ncbi:Phosphoenolpyruvate carboxylase, type 1 [Cnuella takakiae]|uniref:Phosphoenolpyruvate carboxylase n=1 Tax=Cnuella takakiae TaxID=1302690 RepID=A0A1M4ZWC0_9BACT|nr:phosphoenolpyruvate carboxylase [Cnuella takakiae]OLY92181.1 phosphoenolpyruvate carboxylase [Cnuella takakiae]SHF22275.1 Phosphoenolpyruvate carboxylase, type 1 [Cnuella takakiae]
MDHQSTRGLQQFKNSVGIKFQLYNSLFTSLPFHRIEKTGIHLSLLLNHCEEGYKKKHSPQQIIEDFFNRYTNFTNEREQVDLLFRFVQYVERQVVLFDALEDAAFRDVNDINGAGSIKHLESEVLQSGSEEALAEKLKDFAIRLVLTAHPTQFYPGTVLGIINDLSKALSENNAELVNLYLQQLGKTPFFKKQKPTPYDEAVSLVWYLENVFYNAAGRIVSYLKERFPHALAENNSVINMGFWPGGDRDGNPNVTSETTLKVADALRSSILKCYYMDVRRLKRRLTFREVDTMLCDLEDHLYANLFIPGHKADISKQSILDTLKKVREILIHQHNSLFLSQLDMLINKVLVFGLHFANLDIRQDSSVHGKVLGLIAEKEDVLPKNYAGLPDEEKMKLLTGITGKANPDLYDDVLMKDTLVSVQAIKTIQQNNGELGCNRYIISQCNSALNVLEVYGLFLLGGWKKKALTVDIVPLFETIDDLQHAPDIMRQLYENKDYRNHLKLRKDAQTIMVGFSDGTKDGGYLMANWSIYKAKEELTRVSKEYGIDVVFFDGRGGPPARGGGKTHKFYASMGKNISNREIQLTIQGQTVSSNFGTIDSAQYNIEQLLNAGITNDLFPRKERILDESEVQLLQELAEEGLQSYQALKEHANFLPYLSHVSPLQFYAQTNIGSRPAKRSAGAKLSLKDLRAIPFVGSWSQLKQNVPGYYGVGTALQALDKKGKLGELKELYRSSLFFRTLMDNCEMAMKKCFFPLTAHLADDAQFGEIWRMIHGEFELTQRYILLLSDKSELMADYPVDQLSIQMRERIVLPLTTIQQYGISLIREMDEGRVKPASREALERLVVRCSFGIINAGRNSA